MYTIFDAHPFPLCVIMATVMVTPFYVLAVYVFSKASPRKGIITGTWFLLLGTVMTWVCLTRLPMILGMVGSAIVPLAWITPSLLLILARNWFLSEPLSQRMLVGLQLVRVIGGAFLVEMTRNNIPGIFAYPAGLGDIMASLLALGILVVYRKNEYLPRTAVLLVLTVGVADFISALFFGFTSTQGPWQLFALGFDNKLLLFPVGMIPLFLVPYAIFFHVLSFLNLKKFGR